MTKAKARANKIIVAICILLLVVSVAVSSYADVLTPGDIKNTVPDTVAGQDDIANIGGQLLGIFQTVGAVVAVIILLVLGIKYMMGSAEEKADYKKSMIPYVIGAIVIFGAPAIANMVYQLASGITGTGTRD